MIILWLCPLFLIIHACLGVISANTQPAMAFFLLTICLVVKNKCLMVKNMKNQHPSPAPTVTIDPFLVGKKRVRVTGHIT